MDETASSKPILWRIDDRGVAHVILNRPEVYNAYNGDLIASLLEAFDDLGRKKLCAWPWSPVKERISRPAPM